MNIVGIDPSLNGTALAVYLDDEVRTHRFPVKKLRAQARLHYIKQQVMPHIQNADLVVYEDYAMSAKGRVFSIGELGGVLKLFCYEQGIDLLLVPPSSLKMFVTGNGGADKDMVVAAVAERYGVEAPSDDEADAVGLLKLGEAYTNRRKARAYTAKQRSAFEGCTYTEGSILAS